MSRLITYKAIFFFLNVLLALYPVLAQESRYQVLHALDIPAELNLDHHPSCFLQFQEEWVIDPQGLSISKRVDGFQFPCGDSTSIVTLPPGEIRLRNISYEFYFLDLPEQEAKEIQTAFIALIKKRFSIPEVYDPSEQLLSVYFHEDWTIEPGHQRINKKVRAISPVIWQRRQTADGEPLPDAETGYPVFYKQTLDRIDLRQP